MIWSNYKFLWNQSNLSWSKRSRVALKGPDQKKHKLSKMMKMKKKKKDRQLLYQQRRLVFKQHHLSLKGKRRNGIHTWRSHKPWFPNRWWISGAKQKVKILLMYLELQPMDSHLLMYRRWILLSKITHLPLNQYKPNKNSKQLNNKARRQSLNSAVK